jgi:hypothetical protein
MVVRQILGHLLPPASVSRVLLRDDALLERMMRDVLELIYEGAPRGVFRHIQRWLSDVALEEAAGN